MNDIEFHRREIDICDENIVKLLITRLDHVTEIGIIKKQSSIKIRDESRERSQVRTVIDICKKTGKAHLVLPILFAYRHIVESSVILQSGRNGRPEGPLYCVLCNFRTAGVDNPDFNWPVCPVCSMPLFPK